MLDSYACQVMWGGFGRQHQIKFKGQAALVIEANEEAERKIEKILRESFPNREMLTEEGGKRIARARPVGRSIPWTAPPTTHTASRQL